MTKYPHEGSTPIDRFVYFIDERERIRKRKESGKARLTNDPILRKYRFCNIERENDRVTRWIAKNWRSYDDPNVWHAMIIARFINWPNTLEYCGYPEPWTTSRKPEFAIKLKDMEKHGSRIFTGAYIVSTNGATGSKVDHVLGLFDRAWIDLHKRIAARRTCQTFYEALRGVNGIGSFMAAQVVADVKYTNMLCHAPDWMNFVAPGPGSQRGLNRIRGEELHAQWTNDAFAKSLYQLREEAARMLPMVGKLHLQDLQNCLCEFDKYERVLHNQGKPRSMYHPSTVPLP